MATAMIMIIVEASINVGVRVLVARFALPQTRRAGRESEGGGWATNSAATGEYS